MKKVIAAVCTAFMMMGPTVATAKTANAQIPVRAQVVGNCTVSPSGSLDFGTYDGSTAGNVNTTLTVSCTQARTGITVDIASANAFKLVGTAPSTSTLTYALYSTDPSAGSGTAWAQKSINVSKGGSTAVPVYAQIAAGQGAPDDTYTDTLTVTITY